MVSYFELVDAVDPPIATLRGDGPQIAGENYTLTCQVTGGGNALPTYQWFKNSNQIRGETYETLFFSPLNERLHNGVYSCLGTRNHMKQPVEM